MTNIGNDKYLHLVTRRDYLDVISDKVSPDFAAEIEEMLDVAELTKSQLIDEIDSDAAFYEAENEEMRNTIDDANSMIQQFLYPIEKGKNLNRQKTIQFLNDLLKLIDINNWK
jgi:hypothetical protein